MTGPACQPPPQPAGACGPVASPGQPALSSRDDRMSWQGAEAADPGNRGNPRGSSIPHTPPCAPPHAFPLGTLPSCPCLSIVLTPSSSPLPSLDGSRPLRLGLLSTNTTSQHAWSSLCWLFPAFITLPGGNNMSRLFLSQPAPAEPTLQPLTRPAPRLCLHVPGDTLCRWSCTAWGSSSQASRCPRPAAWVALGPAATLTPTSTTGPRHSPREVTRKSWFC